MTKKSIPTWWWLAFILLTVAAVLLVARRVLVESSHQRVLELVKQSQGNGHPKGPSKGGVAAAPAPTSGGTPMADLPLVGAYASGDLAAQKELDQQIKELWSFLENLRSGSRVDGVVSFRAVLAKMGMTVPDTMTEAEAAEEFLKRAEQFSALLAQWRDAVGTGPWNFSSLGTKESSTIGNKIFRISLPLQDLLAAVAEAHLRTGDAVGAWSDLQALNSTADRYGEMPLVGSIGLPFQWWTIQTAHAGMEIGTWTDAQLMGISTMLGEESALASMRRAMDQQKLEMADTFAHFREPQRGLAESFVDSARSPIGKTLSWVGVAMTTDQQIADNLAVIQFQVDQPFTRFDPVTGFYLGESAGTPPELPHSNPDEVSFDKFYYMYAEQFGWHFDRLPEHVIKSQSAIDQTRIAAALEIQRRATGEYPETLDAVSATFGGTPPRDIATGQPYLYQRDPDGGYKLWSTGIDGKNDGGNEKTDILWQHRPVMGR